MPYGTVKVDNIIFDQGGADQSVTVSGIYRAITSGVTVTGTISGATLIGTTIVSGATVTGTTVQGTTVQGVSGTFTSLTGTTITGTTVQGTTVQGTTVQGVSGTFTSLTGTTITGTTINGTTVNSTTGNFTSLTGVTIIGTTVSAPTGSFASLTGTTTTGTTANFVSGVFTTQISGLTVIANTIELGNASDTTLSRSAAGVLAVEGVVIPSISSTSTLTNKTLTDPAIIGTILEDVFTITDGAAFEVDPGNGSIQLITLGASRTPKATNFAAGESVTLMVNDGTAYTLTWTDATWGTGGVIWRGGSAPTLATTGYSVIQFWKVGTQVYGAVVGNVA